MTKTILPGSWRYIGLRMESWGPWNVPVAAISAGALERHFKGNCYQLGRIHVRNVIVVEIDPIRLIYVRPPFRRYRAAALRTFPEAAWDVAIDHCLGKAVAGAWGYQYVLLQRINWQINLQHSKREKVLDSLTAYSDVCFWDSRIRNKPLHRGPDFWGDEQEDYNPNLASYAGLTLKQHGRWGWALGTDDTFAAHPDLSPVTFV